METIYNQDSFFIDITVSETQRKINNDVISLSVTEEMSKMITGTITFLDNEDYYAKEFRAGIKFVLSWGYKKRNETLTSVAVRTINVTEMTGLNVRRGLQCMVVNEGGKADSGGQKTYACKFYGAEFGSNIFDAKVYSSGSKRTCIQDAMTFLGCQTTFIKFNNENVQLNSNNAVRQNEKYFKFLVRLAKEWRCIFKMGYTQTGQLIGMFVDNNQIGSGQVNNFIQSITGAVGSTKLLEFGVGSINPNVSAYDWQHHVGESGQGDHVTISIINGQAVTTRYITEDKKVYVLKLKEDRLKEFLENHSDDAMSILANVMKAKSMDAEVWNKKTIKDFFSAEMIGTAPQGFGFTVNCQMIGDPAMSPPVEIVCGNGFSPQLQEKMPMNKLYCKKVSHTLSGQGYKMNVEVADAITIFGSFVH